MCKFMRILVAIFSGALCFQGAPSHGFDETLVRNVRQNLPEDYRRLGMRFRSLIVEPAVKIEQKYDDNIFRRRDGRVSDHITIASPSLDFRTNWNLHEIRAGAQGDFGRYKSNSSENYDDYSYYVSGRYDLDYETFLNFSVRAEHNHQDRGSLEDANGDNPLEYDVRRYEVGFTRELGVLKLYLNAGFHEYEYEDSVRSGAVINNNERDFRDNIYQARLAYGLTDRFEIYAQSRYDRRRYDTASSVFVDSEGEDYRLGFRANVTGKVQAGGFFGFVQRKNSGVQGESRSFTAGGDVLWNMSDIMSVNASLERRLDAVSLQGVPSVLRTEALLRGELALRQNMFLDGQFSYRDDAYNELASTADRDHVTYGGGVGLEYVVNRGIRAGIEYDFARREYDAVGDDYKNHKVSVSLKLVQ